MGIDQEEKEEILEAGKFQGKVLEHLRGVDARLKKIEIIIEEALKLTNENKIEINKLKAWGFVIVAVIASAFGVLGNFIGRLF